MAEHGPFGRRRLTGFPGGTERNTPTSLSAGDRRVAVSEVGAREETGASLRGFRRSRKNRERAGEGLSYTL